MTEVLPLNTSPLPVRLRIEDYLLLDSSGAFAPYAKTELIDGEILYMNAQHRPHARAKMDLYDAVRDGLRKIGSASRAFVEASVAMPDHSLPEPDIVVTSEPEGDGFIPLRSVELVVEVADTTLTGDLGRKQRIYSRDGIPEYWVVDINRAIIHQMWSPAGEAYAEHREIAFGTTITAATIAGLTVETTTL